ncbi:hypothetical protein F4821DRAFT_248372 [Hypoxylon rubiginosum]|uniref:Uncharacterized protein n=1 Tax=Hypoxylon rubiginosum TaxID=110542 RepID=A0ACC0CN06_9PEZI|nr:hypothetical protein F4821DRAFT_248372 [Hypoxylon rubiginosum]
MASAFREDVSHYEHSDPSTSVHGGRGVDGEGERASDAPLRPSEDASSASHVQEKVPPVVPLTKRQKVRRHCGRFWWWYLIGLIIFLAIFLPILFLVIIPALVQKIINDQPMPISGGAFIVLSPDKLNVSITTTLNTPLPADIDPVTLFMYNKDTPTFSPFVNVTLPPLHVDGQTEIVISEQTVTITNETELITWFGEVFDQPTVKVSTRGDATVHLGKLHSSAHIEKTVEVNSLNKLSGFGIEHMQLLLPALDNGTNIQGTLNLPNLGALSLGIGNLSLNLLAGDVRLGLITVYDVYLPHGNNSKYFNGELFLDVLLQNFGTILTSQEDALNNGNIQIDATGNATVVNGEHIRYLEAILNNRRVSSTIPVTKLLGDLISSFTNGSDVSLPTLFDDIFGNSTFIEEVLTHWNTTGNSTTATKRSLPFARRGPGALSLLKLGMKMGTKWLSTI